MTSQQQKRHNDTQNVLKLNPIFTNPRNKMATHSRAAINKKSLQHSSVQQLKNIASLSSIQWDLSLYFWALLLNLLLKECI